jgi:hypothetical protein
MLDRVIVWLGPVAAPFLLLGVLYLVWGVVSGLFMLIYDKRLPHTDEEWTAVFLRSPKLAAAMGIVKTLGWNIPGGLRALRAFFGGGFPPAIRAIILRTPITRSTDAKVVVRDAAGELVSEVKATVRESVNVTPIRPPAPEADPPKGAA